MRGQAGAAPMEEPSATWTPLEIAYSRDLPLDLIVYEAPQWIGDRPFRLGELLYVLERQLSYMKQQREHRQPPDSVLFHRSDGTAAAVAVAAAAPDVAFMTPLVQELLPVAVSQQHRLKVQLMHSNFAGSAQNSSRANTNHDGDDDHPQHSSSSNNRDTSDTVAAVDAAVDNGGGKKMEAATLEEERELIRDAAAHQLRHYLFSSTAAAKTPALQTAINSLMSGARVVSSGAAEYAELLLELRGVEDRAARAAATAATPAAAVSSSPGAPSARLPSYLRQLLQSNAVAAPERCCPTVKSGMRGVLDLILPPRLVVSYVIEQDIVVALQQEQEALEEQQQALKAELAAHPGDLQRQDTLQMVERRLAEMSSVVVGTETYVVERVSAAPAPREYLVALEESLDSLLQDSRARCCGLPLRAGGTRHPAPAQGRYPKKKYGTIEVEALPKDGVCARTVRATADAPATTVASTLNVLELSYERLVLQYHLLGAELLRQVAIDLPERGLMLRRLLNEGGLSLAAHSVLHRERCRATSERLLDGQEERESLAATAASLQADVASLKAEREALRQRKKGLQVWVKEQKEAEVAEQRRRKSFEEQLFERLATHTSAVRAAQDRERRASLS